MSHAGFGASYTSDGFFRFAIRLDGTDSDVVSGCAIDSKSIFLTGNSKSEQLSIFNTAGATVGSIPGYAGNKYGFVVRFDQNGQWVASNRTIWPLVYTTSTTVFRSTSTTRSTLSTTSTKVTVTSTTVITSSTTDVTSTSVTSELQQVPPGNQVSASEISLTTALIAGSAVAGFIGMAGFISCIFVIRQRNADTRSVKGINTTTQSSMVPVNTRPVSFYDNHTFPSATHTQTTELTNTDADREMTIQVTVHELSIPAFLEMRYGLDFREGNYIARGGGGELYLCSAINQSLVKENH